MIPSLPNEEADSTNANDYHHQPKFWAFSEFADGPQSQAGPTSVEEASSLVGWVWIVLFGFVIMLSVAANVVVTVLTLSHKQKVTSIIHILLFILFGISLMDFCLLCFDFTMGMDRQFPFGQIACTTYQMAAKCIPILQATVLLLIVYFAAANSGLLSTGSLSVLSPPIMRRMPIKQGLCIVTASMIITVLILAFPVSLFAHIVHVDEGDGTEKVFCEIDMSSDLVSRNKQRQAIVSIFYLVFCSFFTYWLVLLVAMPILCMPVRTNPGDKNPEISLVLATISSFLVFFAPHATTVAVRHSLDLGGVELTPYETWILQVVQSLCWLFAYFWHFSRPALVLLVDPDFREVIMASRVSRLLAITPTLDSQVDDDQELAVMIHQVMVSSHHEG